ncbi:hypothetical protein NLI96_g13339 [Meripilus lineatus]|uniref:Uncharacterized protein n=1 Tax=Meripilus lineatus TaxID=2056292 RepID=A0AAD5Y918_9APHY|nr:hypothetical protein NLI96_g13339 [Physisporinus lineatus]
MAKRKGTHLRTKQDGSRSQAKDKVRISFDLYEKITHHLEKSKPSRTEEKAEKVKDARMRILGEVGEAFNSQAKDKVRICSLNKRHYSPLPSAIQTYPDREEIKKNSEEVKEKNGRRGRRARGGYNDFNTRREVIGQSEDLPEVWS